MGATSVTGIGMGMAYNQKGPGNNRNQFVPEVCPHVIAAGSATCAANAATVWFPDHLDAAAANYVVMLTSYDVEAAATHNVHVVTKHDNTASKFDYFTIYSETADDVVDWVVINKGLGLDVHA
jgi:hypothetical protein